MSKDKSDTLKIGKTIIPQWLVTILASLVTSLIAGYFTLQASVLPIHIQISATQTAQAQTTTLPITTIIPQQAATTQPAVVAPNNTVNNTNQTSSTLGENLILFLQKYYWLLLLWFFIAVSNKSQRTLLVEQLSMLFSKPVIFTNDDTTPIPLYPRKFLEQTAKTLTQVSSSDFSQSIKSSVIDYIKISVQSQLVNYFSYAMRLIMFLCFTMGMVISMLSSLQSMSVISNVPEWLSRYDIAITFGSIFASMLGFWVLAEPNALMSKTFNGSHPFWGKLIKLFSLLLIIFSLLTMVILAIARLYHLGIFSSSYETIISQTISIMMASIVPLNNLLASILLLPDALFGFVIVFVSLLLALLYISEFLFSITVSVTIFVFDVIFRMLIIYIYITSFLFITPIDTVLTIAKVSLNKNAT